jgi:nucleotide-binding universal stress UspA family protein
MKVLFCTDGSKISYHAIQNFNNWVKNFTIDILCAIDWSFMPDNVLVEDSDFATYCTNSADSILDYSAKFLKELGINVGEKIKMCGTTVDCILEILDKSDYDYVVLGSHGKKGIQKWLGSVSQEVSSLAHVSTYISKEKNFRQKVVFAVDNSNSSQYMIRNCLSNLNLQDKEIQLVTVFEIPDYLFLEGNVDSSWILDIDKKQETAAMILLNNFENLIVQNGLTVENKVILRGNPSTEIIKYLVKEDADLVVCGVHEYKKFHKFLLSSVSRRILELAKSDVLIIKQDND